MASIASKLSKKAGDQRMPPTTTYEMPTKGRGYLRCETGAEKAFGIDESLASFDEFQALFYRLDKQYFEGRLTAARYRAEQRDLDKWSGTPEYYFGLDGDIHTTTLEEEVFGKCIEAQHVILVGLHDVRNALLHEMCHAIVDLNRPLRKGADRHGRRFVQELRRIRHVDYSQYAHRLCRPLFCDLLPETIGNSHTARLEV